MRDREVTNRTSCARPTAFIAV